MRFDFLLSPISGDAPCGADLLLEDDPDFVNYYFEVDARFPERYINIATGEVFDPKSVDLKAEQKAIEGLLKKSRDLRLLAIDAQFSILAGKFKPFSEAVVAMANLLDEFPADVHPSLDEIQDRRNAVEALETSATVLRPLDYAVLLTDRRAGDITFRGYQLATGQADARDGESTPDLGAITGVLSGSESAGEVEAAFAQVEGAQDALARISAACKGLPDGNAFTPGLEKVTAKLEELRDMFVGARADLGGGEAAAGEDAGEGGDAPGADEATMPMEAPSGGGGTIAVAAMPSGGDAKFTLSNHADARAVLWAAERYFSFNEPSSPSLILVVQARQLIGRPLVEALDLLLPNRADNSIIDFGAETGFAIAMGRMRALSGEANLNDGDGGPAPDAGIPEAFETRDQASAALKAIEDFFRMREPTSPIPILMFKARSYLAKDFHAIVRELLPSEGN